MKIYNTLSKSKEEFVPITPGTANIYACGPTVYNYIHIGNARPLCVFDILRRYLEYRGYKVNFVQNFTDIDDKIIKRATEENTDYKTVAERYIAEYKTDAKGLGVKAATINPKATENIAEIIELVSTLIEKGHAYLAENGDVYFNTKSFEQYGKLSHQNLDELEAGARISVGEIKNDPMDFALWKAAKPGEPFWTSPFGNGRPGWHIECSAMAGKYLGKTIDIHCGGQDLIFPHHENEVAQSECCNDAAFANYWMHNGYINVDNRKMSKSLNNFFTVRDVAEKYGYEPIRYMLISSHYRSPINYSAEIIEQCIAALERLHNCYDNLVFTLQNSTAEQNPTDDELTKKLLTHKDAFIKAMDDDLNTADAIASIFELCRDINTMTAPAENPSKKLCEFALQLFNELNDVIGVVQIKAEASDESGFAAEVEALIEQRQQARKNKDFAAADKIRDDLKAKGVILEDTPLGVKWKRA
ncbi:MAG: cysteine--tRNA ligase [Oscillospiraceae bacterium]|jgi:cysteinyl-tRNA synthetase|nr:cysteine--tRNA ligase [Oscillospiraceae bacterium]